jgi:hypothetical protein
MQQKNLRVVITLMLSLLCWEPGVWAEPYIAAYAGFSLLSDTDLKADSVNILQRTLFQARGIRFSTDVDNSAIFGGKIGYWFDFSRWWELSLIYTHLALIFLRHHKPAEQFN